MSTIHHISYKN